MEHQEDFETDYEVWVNDECVAGSNSKREALNYAYRYLEEGDVQVVEVRRKVIATLETR